MLLGTEARVVAGAKFSVVPLISAHYATFVDARSDTRRKRDYFAFVGVPVAIGAIVIFANVRLGALTAVLTGIATLTGLLFGFVIWTFGLRVQILRDPRIPKLSAAPRRLDELFANASYAALVALTTIAVAVAAVTAQHGEHANRWWSAAVLVLVSHLLLTLAMCLKRLHSAFELLTM